MVFGVTLHAEISQVHALRESWHAVKIAKFFDSKIFYLKHFNLHS
jgi:hypothetical protein